jgi:hypothetical protein
MADNPQAVAAAIRRASQQARQAMQQLDEQAAAELEAIYTEAADQVRAAIAASAGSAGRVELDRLRDLLQYVQGVLDALAQGRDALVQANIDAAAELGVRPYTGAGLAATGRAASAVLDGGQALQVADEAANFVRTFRAADGLVLSDRLWRTSRGAREAVGRAIEQAVVQGFSADQAAQQFIMRGQAVPPATVQAQGASRVGQVMTAADLLQDKAAGPLADTLRVMRTEINRAHGEAYMVGAERAPGVVGFRFLLSPRHPRPDICDLYARQNLHGLGPGVYPTRQACPWPAHPNTLSFVVAVFADELRPEHQNGKETTLEALQRLGPELRAGILGPTKAGYFDQGVLGTGMVRSTVGAVRARVERVAARG